MSFRRFSRRLAQSWVPGERLRLVVRSVDSTSSLARRIVSAYRADGERPPATVVIAYHQSDGRGRGDRVWESPAGQGIYVSLLLPAVAPERLPELPLRVGLGLAEALEPAMGRAVRLRWPNDLLVAGRKLGGILIESTTAPGGDATAIVGFGVNWRRSAVDGAISILEARSGTGSPEEHAETAADLIDAVDRELQREEDAAATARRYAAASIHRSGDRLRCRTPTGVVEGRFRGFDRHGFLRLETAEGERAMGSADLLWAGESR